MARNVVYSKIIVKRRPTIITPPLIDVGVEEPVNATNEDFGDVELREGVTLKIAIVVEGMYGDCVLGCDVERAPTGVVDDENEEDESVLLDPSFALGVAEPCVCA